MNMDMDLDLNLEDFQINDGIGFENLVWNFFATVSSVLELLLQLFGKFA